MPVDERARHALYQRLEQVLGVEHAATLMGHLPPLGWADIATRDDLRGLQQRLERRIDGMEQRLDQRIDGLEQRLDQRIDGLEQRLDQGIDGLEQRTDLKLQALEHRVLSTFHRELVTQTRLYVVAMVGSLGTVAGLAFAAARLI